MKILVIGGSGVIGYQLVNYFFKKQVNVDFTYKTNKLDFVKGNELDITNQNETLGLIQKSKPDVVIQTAALTNVDYCEKNHSIADSINVQGTSNIIKACKIINCKIIYISTSFVFDGSKEQYFEDDKSSPSTYYGITKHEGEKLTKESGLQYLILRTDQPYCWTKKWQHPISVLRVLNSLRSGKKLKEIKNWYNTPTYVPDFINVVSKLLSENSSGIYHLVGSDFISRYNWALIIAKIF